MSPDTIKRIASAVILAALVIICVYYGKITTLGLVFSFGAIAVDEIFCNFLRKKRFGVNYLLAQIVFVVPFIYLHYMQNWPHINGIFINAAMVMNLIMLVYLFYVDMESKAVLLFVEKVPVIAGIYILLPMMALADFVHLPNWRVVLGALLFVNFGMDTGAWFFGKNFGRHKLWISVSPNKTVEGLIGGVLTSGIVGGIFWHLAIGTMSVQHFVIFSFLGLLSHLGDLVQSKLKRQYNIKDSSRLIPGHGGVLDRIDSLLFLSPFFATALRLFLL